MTGIELPHTLDIWDWHTPASDYPEETVGTARIKRIGSPRGYYYAWGVDGNLFFRQRHRIPITNLQIKEGRKWQTWMVDDYPSYRCMQIFAENAWGRVLVAGLGLGLVCHTLSHNKDVGAITVVEINQDVIGMVAKHVMWQSMQEASDSELQSTMYYSSGGRKHYKQYVAIVKDDFYNFVDTDKVQWDTIIVDLWHSSSKEDKERITPEVLALAMRLRFQYPNAKLAFHGFPQFSDIKVVSNETMELIKKYRPYD